MIYDEFCIEKECEHYITWKSDGGHPCMSCTLIGQSYNITEYPDNCPFIDEIKKYNDGIPF